MHHPVPYGWDEKGWNALEILLSTVDFFLPPFHTLPPPPLPAFSDGCLSFLTDISGLLLRCSVLSAGPPSVSLPVIELWLSVGDADV